MEMKYMKISAIVVLLLFLTIPALAQDELTDPGITPDSLLYPIDLFLDDVNLAVTFNEDTKLDKQFKIAEERIAEAQLMLKSGNTVAANRAIYEHNELMEQVQLRTRDNSTEMLKSQLQLEEKLRTHNELIVDAGSELLPECQGVLNGTMNQTRTMTEALSQEKTRTMAEIDNSDVIEEELKEELGIVNSVNGAKGKQVNIN